MNSIYFLVTFYCGHDLYLTQMFRVNHQRVLVQNHKVSLFSQSYRTCLILHIRLPSRVDGYSFQCIIHWNSLILSKDSATQSFSDNCTFQNLKEGVLAINKTCNDDGGIIVDGVDDVSLDGWFDRIHAIGPLGAHEQLIVFVSPVVDVNGEEGSMHIQLHHSVKLIISKHLTVYHHKSRVFLQLAVFLGPFNSI